MKSSLSFAALALVALSFPQESKAVAPTGSVVHLQLHSTSTIPYNSWTEVVSATAGRVKEISVYSTATNPIEIGVGAAGDEVVHALVPQGVNSSTDWAGAPASAFSARQNIFHFGLANNKRVAVRCKRSSCVVGELQMNFQYYP